MSLTIENWPEKDPPVFEGKALGYRGWYANRLADRTIPKSLKALVVDTNWNPGLNKSYCFLSESERLNIGVDKHESPGAECRCGMNAYNLFDEALVRTELDYALRGRPAFNPIVGSITGFGNLQLHENGWRSEYSEIIALYAFINTEPGWRLDVFKEVADRYEVPLFTDETEFVDYSESKALLVPELELYI